MRFYRPLGPVSAITFDLDDTLYDNRPVIQRTTREVLTFIREYHPRLHDFTEDDFEQHRQQSARRDPAICHDVTEWRRQAILLAMQAARLSPAEALQGAREAMIHFAQWRSAIDIPKETHDTLAKLARKWPLVAVTNGNADPARCGLDGYFRFVLRAGPDGRAKPAEDMYLLAAQQLGVPVGNILHVGDDLITDVAGAVLSGMQACWINTGSGDLMHAKPCRLLPHLEISRLASLLTLI